MGIQSSFQKVLVCDLVNSFEKDRWWHHIDTNVYGALDEKIGGRFGDAHE